MCVRVCLGGEVCEGVSVYVGVHICSSICLSFCLSLSVQAIEHVLVIEREEADVDTHFLMRGSQDCALLTSFRRRAISAFFLRLRAFLSATQKREGLGTNQMSHTHKSTANIFSQVGCTMRARVVTEGGTHLFCLSIQRRSSRHSASSRLYCKG